MPRQIAKRTSKIRPDFKEVDGGKRLLRHGKACDLAEALNVSRQLIEQPPAGCYARRISISRERHSKGPRAFVTICFERHDATGD